MTDLLLSASQFLLAFTLVGMLAAQHVLVRPGMNASGLRLAANLDRAYGVSALVLLGVGFGRVYWGAQGSSFYPSNALFWTKIGLFATIALLSLPPTLQLIRWGKQARLQEHFIPPDEQIRRMQW